MALETLSSASAQEQPSLPTLESVANKLQILLMPLAYEKNHPGSHADTSNSEIKKAMVNEWLTQYAGPFREYLEAPEHTHETFDFDDPEALIQFLQKIEASKETLH